MATLQQANTGDFIEYALAPGMRLFVAPTGHFKRTRVSFFVHDELNRDRVSLGGLLPFVQKRGTKSYPTGEALERASDELYHANLSGAVHKVGDRQVLGYSLDMPADRFLPRPSLGAGLELLGEMIYEPVRTDGAFHADYVRQEKQFQVGRVRALVNDKIRYAFFRAMEEMFQGEPFAEYELGSVERIQQATAEGLSEHHRQLLSTRPVDIYVVGDVDPDTVKADVGGPLVEPNQRWVDGGKGISDASVIDIPPTDVRMGEGDVRHVTQEEHMNQGWLVIGLRSDVRRADDDRYGLLFFNGILGGFAHSKLFVNVREKASLAYSAFSFYDSNKGVISAVAGIDVGKKDEALAIMKRQIDDVAEGRFSDEDMEATRRALLTGYRVRRDSTGGRILHHLGGLAENCVETIEDVLARVQQVTKDDVRTAAQRIRKDMIYFLKGTGEAGDGP